MVLLNNQYLFNGGNYECIPNNKFLNICSKDKTGSYKVFDECFKSCDHFYIKYNLEKSLLKDEINHLKKFFIFLIEQNFLVLLKGGSVLGIKTLQLIYEKNKSLTIDSLTMFLKLNLIKDFDFIVYTGLNVDKSEKTYPIPKNIFDIAVNNNILSYGKSIGILRYDKANKNKNNDYQYEISVKKNMNIASQEIPLTSMHLKVTKDNLDDIFLLGDMFYNYNDNNILPDSDYLVYFLKSYQIEILKCKNGFFDIDKVHYDGLTKEIINCINITTNLSFERQFLVNLIIDPSRLFFRFIHKNIPKSREILKLFNYFDIDKQDWLIDEKVSLKIIDTFLNNLSDLLISIYDESLVSDIEKINDYNNILKMINAKSNFERYQFFMNKFEKKLAVSDKNDEKYNDILNNYESNKKRYYELKNILSNDALLNKYNLDIDKITFDEYTKKRTDELMFFKEKIENMSVNINNIFIGIRIGVLSSAYSSFPLEAKQMILKIMEKFIGKLDRFTIKILISDSRYIFNELLSKVYDEFIKEKEKNVYKKLL